ncbi:hypothetical protein HG263_21810 [Pseudoalteromonas sp. JBTF-M23]|uniref:Uncharacterized protein n=1 Tax=Pseudoalteromonas caenipelagi TaxID=2726988 RepID=A0A849VNC4_9GAMM|nr:hypothetical protein [Pseudoalteromonas caenipelagi]NOU53141.1 hypothetical protein [Pseudoalteromonas caenipelagi]
MYNEEQDRKALHCIAGYLHHSGCKSFEDVDVALELLIVQAKVTQSEYRNGTAEKATSVN